MEQNHERFKMAANVGNKNLENLKPWELKELLN